MPSDNGTPFGVVAKLLRADPSGAIQFFALKTNSDGITSERRAVAKYAAGNGDARNKVAQRWAGDQRLTNGQAISASRIAEMLEAAELLAVRELELQTDAAGATTGQARPVGDELDVSRTARPDLFYSSDVSGLTVATTRATPEGQPVGCWELLLQWKDGRRQSLAVIPKNLDTLDGKLWFAFIPQPPKAGTIPTWSSAGRTEWLKGFTPSPRAVFHELCELAWTHIWFPGEAEADGPAVGTVALWLILTYCYPCWPAVPYLWLFGPKASGKTKLAEVIDRLAWRALMVSSISAATLFRHVDERGGTIILDEAERLREAKPTPDVVELKCILQSGYRVGGQAARLEKARDTFALRTFGTYGPKVICGINTLGDVLASRCIKLTMARPNKNVPQIQSQLDGDPGRWVRARDVLHAFALTHGAALYDLGRTAPAVPCTGATGRDAELWRPILALATMVEADGEDGLVEQMSQFATRTITDSAEDTANEIDGAVLSLLASRVKAGTADLTAGDLLGLAKGQDEKAFGMWTGRTIATCLRRYGVHSAKIGSRRTYRDVALTDLRRVGEAYSMDLGLGLDADQPAPEAKAEPRDDGLAF